MYRTGVYFAEWTVYDGSQPADIPVDYVTNIFYAFPRLMRSSIAFEDEFAALKQPLNFTLANTTVESRGNVGQLMELKKLNRALRVSLSIGGAETTKLFNRITGASSTDAFVKSVCEMVAVHGFDGVDIDWEYPKTAEEAEQLLSLIRSMRAQLDLLEADNGMRKGDLLLTVAVPVDKTFRSLLNLKAIDEHVSFWNIMGYDYAGSWSKVSNLQSNLFDAGEVTDNEVPSTDEAMVYYNQSIPASKLVLGMPAYGRVFHHSQGLGKTFKNGNSQLLENYNKLPLSNTTEVYDENRIGAYCYDAENKVLVTYDNPRSARAKAKYVAHNGFGGGMWWDASGDTYEDPERCLLINFVEELGGKDMLLGEENFNWRLGPSTEKNSASVQFPMPLAALVLLLTLFHWIPQKF